jgi:DNA-binding IclR family transcriptional regulator
LAEALREHGGHVTRAAAAAGISRQRAYRLMRGLQRIDLDEMRRRQPVAGQSGDQE